MAENTDTARRLAAMSDAAAFEHIAAAVLRSSNSQLYGNLAHPGVQPGGKTVKAPFDNIGWVQSAEGLRFACAAHTTDQKDLEGKWLHDPAQVKPRKAGGKPTKPAGDLVKGIAEIRKLREAHPGLTVTFALTTNREPSLHLSSSLEQLAKSAEIELDVWSVSRIAHFLDTDPTGQIIRRNHLGTPVKLISRDLLLQMGKRSIQDHLLLASADESIHRDNFALGRGDTLVVGASGMGKTTSCAITLSSYIEKGLPAIVLKTEFLITAVTMEAALEGELRRQEPELEAGAGEKALSLCTEEEPLLVLVEDLNRATSPGLLLNKVLSWTRTSKRAWRAVCPVWPQLIDVIEDQKRVLASIEVLRVERYNPEEAIRAIRKRANIIGLQLDEHHARSIADQLGQDPLLIGLHDLVSEGAASDVIQTYIEERLGIVASQAQHTRSEVLQALYQLLRCMLQRRALNPRWSEAKSWIADQDVIALLRHITREGNVMRISDTEEEGTLEFRHDRVLYSLFSGAIAEAFKEDTLPDYVTEPFFSEAVATAAVRIELPLPQLANLMNTSPVTAAHALRLASEIGSDYIHTAVQALSHWLERDAKGTFFTSRRYAIACVLAETTSPYVLELVAQFQSDDRPWYPLLAAAFRNGNLDAGLSLLSIFELGVTVAGKQNLLALVKSMYGRDLVAAVDDILHRADQSIFSNRLGALRLAGYLGDRSFAQAIRICWDQDDRRNDILSSYLFAAARCCGDEPEATLGPVCDAWEALPTEPDSMMGQPVERLAADYVAWEFRAYIPRDAIRYFVDRANASEKIRWPITYMLRTIDHPDAVEQIVRYAANSSYVAAHALASDWERHAREAGRCMSSESKERLLTIACDETEPEEVRKRAFAFWGITVDKPDLEIARQLLAGSPLHEHALWIRIRLKDKTVIPEVLNKIPEHPEYWLQIGRYLWSDALTEALHPLLDQLAEDQRERTDLEYSVAEALKNVAPKQVVTMLSYQWAKLKAKPLLVQALLLLTIPQAANLVRDAFSTSQNPGDILKHFVFSATRQSNENFSLPQLHNLKPYLVFFPENEIQELWRACTERGWLDFRTKHLEPQMKASDYIACLPDEHVDTKHLDRALAGRAGEIVSLHSWLGHSVYRGMTRDRVIAEMLEWLKRHDEERALAIVGKIVSHEATRREFQIFEVAIKKRAGAEPYLEAIRFDVFNRTLT